MEEASSGSERSSRGWDGRDGRVCERCRWVQEQGVARAMQPGKQRADAMRGADPRLGRTERDVRMGAATPAIQECHISDCEIGTTTRQCRRTTRHATHTSHTSALRHNLF